MAKADDHMSRRDQPPADPTEEAQRILTEARAVLREMQATHRDMIKTMREARTLTAKLAQETREAVLKANLTGIEDMRKETQECISFAANKIIGQFEELANALMCIDGKGGIPLHAVIEVLAQNPGQGLIEPIPHTHSLDVDPL